MEPSLFETNFDETAILKCIRRDPIFFSFLQEPWQHGRELEEVFSTRTIFRIGGQLDEKLVL